MCTYVSQKHFDIRIGIPKHENPFKYFASTYLLYFLVKLTISLKDYNFYVETESSTIT